MSTMDYKEPKKRVTKNDKKNKKQVFSQKHVRNLLKQKEVSQAKKKRWRLTTHRMLTIPKWTYLITLKIGSSRSLERRVRSSTGLPTNLDSTTYGMTRRRKIIEIWGPLYTHLNQQSAHVIRCELDFFLKPKLEENISKNQDVQTPIEAC
jgi:hypothetical protein